MSPAEGGESAEASGLAESEALRRMYRITANHERPFEEKLADLLALGRAHLGVQSGFLTEIDDDTQRIVAASGDHELLQAGASCPLSKAYCRKTIDRERALTVQHATVEGWEGDAAYERFGLESYIGAKVVVDGEIFGTFCFADAEPREEPFTQDEETFVELMAEWVSYELFQERATERIERQRDRLEEFARVVSHDLRNPLGILQGYLDRAEETGDPEHFERCRDAVERMNALVDDLLVLAREGEAIAEREPVDLAGLAAECWSVVATGDATLAVETDAVVRGDESRLRQLFENLFRNAVEHGGPAVAVRVGDLADGFYVEDDGSGIPAAERDSVLAEGYSTSDEGTGYGLAIVEQVVEAHGWELTVAESSAGGARFEVSAVDPSVAGGAVGGGERADPTGGP